MTGLAFISFWFAPTAFAQNASQDGQKLANLTIQVRPEFDQPNVLVIYNGELAAKDGYPREVSVLVPRDAQLNATAYVTANDELVNTDPATTSDAGDGYTRVTFKLPISKFQVEYYYNPLQGSPDKKMEFFYKSAQAAEQVQLQIQEPLKSENFVTVPASIVQTSNAHNFKYHIFDYATLTPGQVLDVKISYTKTDPNPSVQNVTIPETADTSAQSALTPQVLIPAVLLAGAVALLSLGGWAWWTRRRAAEFEEEAPRAARGRDRRGGRGFCPQCGHALGPEDNFCPRCGTRRRA